MKYYVIYTDHAIYDTVVKEFDNASQVCDFIEEKLISWDYEADDFQVVHGDTFGIKDVTTTKVYLTNNG